MKKGDQNALVLLTEYKNLAAFENRDKVFASIAAQLPNTPPGVIKPTYPEGLYETEDTRVFMEEPAQACSPGFKLLAKD